MRGAQGFGVGDGGGVVGADAVQQFACFFGRAFARVCRAQVAFAQVGYGADDGFRRAIAVAQEQYFVGGFARGADDVDVQRAQDVARGVEEGGRVVVARGDDDVAAVSGGDATEELVILRLAAWRRRGGVEDVAGNDERVDVFGVQGGGKPVKEGGKFVMATAAVEVAAEVDVGGVQEFQGMMRFRGCLQFESPSPRAPCKMHPHFAWVPARCGLRPAREGLNCQHALAYSRRFLAWGGG